ncbi:hypothetical protein FB451DRAFT_635664 [Mycena latifolia]|nr:hypothetical protein FB451DRAFT_635664 [Mycena latifolia]
MGKFTKDEWTKGTETLKISSLSQLAMAVSDLEKLLIQGKPDREGNSGKEGSVRQVRVREVRHRPQSCIPNLILVLLHPGQTRVRRLGLFLAACTDCIQTIAQY